MAIGAHHHQIGIDFRRAAIQFLADDTPFSSRPRAEDEFDAVATEGQGVDGAGAVEQGDGLPF